VLEQPHEFGSLAARDCRSALVHGRKRLLVASQAAADAPFDRRAGATGKKPDGQIAARVNHLVTIAW